MNRVYLRRLVILVILLCASTVAIQLLAGFVLPVYNWIGLAYLFLITILIHSFVQSARDKANSLIRRLMIASLMRMILGVIFLVVTLFNTHPVNLQFVIFYCAYFCVFMLFEISQMRTNLRPDLEQRPNNGNA